MNENMTSPKGIVWFGGLQLLPAVPVFIFAIIFLLFFLFEDDVPIQAAISTTLFFSLTGWFFAAGVIIGPRNKLSYAAFVLNIVAWLGFLLFWLVRFKPSVDSHFLSIIFPALLMFLYILSMIIYGSLKKVRAYYFHQDNRPERKALIKLLVFYFLLFAGPTGAVYLVHNVAASHVPVSGKYIESSGDYKAYSHRNLVDHNLKTWWTPYNRDGRAAWVKFYFDGKQTVSAVEIHPGSHYPDYPKHGDLFKLNSRLAEAQLVFDDGTSQVIKIEDEDRLQVIKIKPKKTGSLILRVRKTREGKKWNDLCISWFRPLKKEKYFKEE